MANRKPTLVVDIDGVLCTEGGSYSERTPIQNVIDKVGTLSSSYYIVLWTSRPISSRKVTLRWLRENKVVFNKLVLGKLRSRYYIDDKALTPTEFLTRTDI